MKKKLFTFGVIIYMVSSGSAFANDPYADALQGTYGGAQVALLSIEKNGAKATPKAIISKLGLSLNRTISIEARFGFGLSNGTVTEKGKTTDKKGTIKSILGAYSVAKLPVNQFASVYGLIGFSDVSFSSNTTINSSGLSFGAGLNYKFKKNLALNVEYIKYLNNSDELSVGGFSFGATMDF